jgi:CRISPR/Cas system-associated endonuclease Cas3-HD
MSIFNKNFGLDTEEVFRDYLKTESYYATADNYTTGRFQPTHQTIKNNVWKWACRNPERSYEIISELMRSTGNEISLEEWERELVWNSRYGLSLREREAFLNQGNRREILIKMANKELTRYAYGLHATTISNFIPK